MVREGLVCFFDGNEKIKLRFRLAGAGVGVGTCFYHIGNKTHTYKVVVENILLPKCLDFAHAMATMLATYYIFHVSRNIYVETTLIFFQKYKY